MHYFFTHFCDHACLFDDASGWPREVKKMMGMDTVGKATGDRIIDRVRDELAKLLPPEEVDMVAHGPAGEPIQPPYCMRTSFWPQIHLTRPRLNHHPRLY